MLQSVAAYPKWQNSKYLITNIAVFHQNTNTKSDDRGKAITIQTKWQNVNELIKTILKARQVLDAMKKTYW